MNSLVADYSSSEDEESGDSDDSRQSSGPSSKLISLLSGSKTFTHDLNSCNKLPLPDFATSSNSSLTTSVFSNPFSEAERAKKAILEKHVKMTPTRDNIKMINGKKICWNFRKGRCRFGHKCKFAHDSDLHNSDAQSVTEDHELSVDDYILTNQVLPPEEDSHQVDAEDDDTTQRTSRKRPGLSQGLIPSKKVMKMYKKHSKRSSSISLKNSS